MAWLKLAAPFEQALPLLALINVDGEGRGAAAGRSGSRCLEDAMEAGEVLDAIVASQSPRCNGCGSCARARPSSTIICIPQSTSTVSLPRSRHRSLCRSLHAGLCRALAWSPGAVLRPCGRRQPPCLGGWQDRQRRMRAGGGDPLPHRGEMQGSVSAEHGIRSAQKPYLRATAARPQSWRRCGTIAGPRSPGPDESRKGV